MARVALGVYHVRRCSRIAEISGLNFFPRDYLFVLFKGYFDGGNKPDSKEYDTVTLAALFGQIGSFTRLERKWIPNLKKHGAPYLHTTDAISLEGAYKSWTNGQVNAFIQDCSNIMRDSALAHVAGRLVGLVPCTVTVVLKDFKRVQSEIPSGPQDATEVLATQSLGRMIEAGRWMEADFYYLYFDRNEPYRGHICDRLRNPRFKRAMKEQNNIDTDRRFKEPMEVEMRDVPALQAADLLAWCVGHKKSVRFTWQKTVLSIKRMEEWLDYRWLRNPDMAARAVDNYCKFPRRSPTR
jgi:hypothetical protein